MGTPAGNGAWDSETNTYSWTLGYSNLATIFDCNTESLKGYTKIYLETSDLVDGPYRICFMKGSSTLATIAFYSAGVKDLKFADRDETKNLDLKEVTHISFGGASGAGSVKLTKAYLEGPDIPTEATIKTTVGTDIKNLTGTNTNWANTVTYPMAFQSQSTAWGDGNGDKESTHVNISDYSKLSFNVTKGSDKGLALRVWIWDGTKVVTLYPHPDADYATADFTQAYEIKNAGVYSVNISDYTYLKGVKAANKYESQTAVTVNYAWLSNGEKAIAVDEALTYNFDYPLDFSEVTDVEAYIATSVDGSKVTMTKVEGAVPANTGLVLKQVNDKAVISIPTCETATVDVTANKLVATTAETGVTSGYVLAGTGETLGWYSVGSVKPTLAAGKAYLAANSAAKQLQFVWGEEEDTPTAVDAVVEVKTVADNAYYTIAGVKVAQPVKGNLYIHNGKKIVF